MWRHRAAEALALGAAATLVTFVIGASTLRAPAERLFGMPIVGRHYDPFAVMTQMTAPATARLYLQPITDIPAALAARLIGPVAAYNWIVLASFPLSAAMAFLLARHLGLSRLAAGIAAMAYAFSPFHIAQAAYHAHVSQTQWLPLYLLALLSCLEHATPKAVVCLGMATLAVMLSNYYGGLIAAVITPFAVAAYCWSNRNARPSLTLAMTITTLGAGATCVAAYAYFAAQRIAANPMDLAYQRTDLFRYGATWWSYLVPPVAHPLLGATAQRMWEAAGIREGLLEQQLAIGVGIAALALVGAAGWWRRDGSRSATFVPMLAGLAAVAFACSLAPERTPGLSIRPAAWFYEIAPMFRSYARFGVMVQLAVVMLAGIGIDRLRRAGTRRALIACIGLIVLATGEYAVRPSAMSRDVLPTAAHRWVVTHHPHARVLDCAPLTMESESVEWLTRGRVTLAGTVIDSCLDAQLPELLAAHGFTHVIERPPFAEARTTQSGLMIDARFDDGRVYAVTARPPALYTAATAGFRAREPHADLAGRWMDGEAKWIVVNTAGTLVPAMLSLELSAFEHARTLELWLDGQCVHSLLVLPGAKLYEVGPIRVLPGAHELVFHPVEVPVGASASFAIGASRWRVEGQP